VARGRGDNVDTNFGRVAPNKIWERKHIRVTEREIIFEEFQPMSSQSINVTDGQTDRQTDRRTDRRHAIARPRFALCGASRGKNSYYNCDEANVQIYARSPIQEC